MLYQNCINELNNATYIQKGRWSTLHALSLIEERNKFRPSKGSRLEHDLKTGYLREFVEEKKKRHFLFWSVPVYSLSRYGNEIMDSNRKRIEQTQQLLKDEKQEDAAEVLIKNGYAPGDFLVKKILLFSRLHQEIPYGAFEQSVGDYKKLGDYIENLLKKRTKKKESTDAVLDTIVDYWIYDSLTPDIEDFFDDSFDDFDFD